MLGGPSYAAGVKKTCLLQPGEVAHGFCVLWVRRGSEGSAVP